MKKILGFIFRLQFLIPALFGTEPLKILYIGNSYTGANNLPQVVQAMAEQLAEPVAISTQKLTPGGYTLERHAAERRAKSLIESFKPDIVILQEQSQMPVVDPTRTIAGARKLHQDITPIKARTVLYMTWARQHLPEMIDGLSTTYLTLGKELAADVAPVGLAWQRALTEHPEWPLHTADKSHPNPLGTYLAACVILATLVDQNVTSLPDDLGFGLPPPSAEQARYYQSLAMKITREGRP